MIIVWGFRCYGQVQRAFGEYATTKFFHVFWLPIIPVQSYWISSNGETELPQHGRSIAAGYARVWSIVAAVIAFGLWRDTSFLSLLAIPPLAYLAYRSWRGRNASDLEAKRAAFHRAAYAIGCDPKYLPAALAEHVRTSTNAAWPEAGGGRTPHDTAQLGARNGREATCAYMMLRLAEKKLRGAEATEHAIAADRIVLGQEQPSALDGPYRGVVEHAPVAGAPATLPAAAAAVAAVAPPRVTPRRFDASPLLATIGTLVCSFVGLALVVTANAPPARLWASDFGDRNALVDRGRVELACDELVADRGGNQGDQFMRCTLGTHRVFVRFQHGDAPPTNPIRGHLESVRWPRYAGVFDDDWREGSDAVFVAERPIGRQAMTLTGILMLLAFPALFAFRRLSGRRRSRSAHPA